MAHYKRKRPRTKDCGVSDYKHLVRRRGGEDNVNRLFSSCSSGWNTLFHIRPRRRKERHLAISIMKGADPDNVSWPVPGKPHVYYW